MMQPAGSEKIPNISEYILSCDRQLTHVAVFRKLEYYHHYLVLGVGDSFVDIVHYGSVKPLPVIIQQRINFDSDLLDFSSGVFFIKKQNYPSTDEENDLAYERLCSRLGETEYSASSNNCESFVTWVLTGEAKCEQFEQSSPGKRGLVDCIDSGLDQGTKVIRGVIKEDIETSLANVSISDSNVRCFLWASVLTAITGAKTVVKVGTSAIAAAASSNITVVVAAPIEIISCGKEIVNMYRKKQETHLSTKTFTRQVTKKIGGSVTSVVTATGSEIAGACIGQMVIPFPILGGVIGGSIGGALGSLSGRVAGAVVSGQIFDTAAHHWSALKTR